VHRLEKLKRYETRLDRTFERLTARHDAFVGVSLAGMARKLGLLQDKPW